ncbi:MAG: type VI secretion system tube protein Hcp [Acetobacteraceae bacterium]
MAIFVKYGSLKGEATAKGYENGWFECNSFQLGMGRGVSVSGAGGSRREATAPSVSEIVLTKEMDVIDPLLWKEALGGGSSKVEIHLTQTDKDGKHIAFQKYELEDTLISGYSISGGSGRPSISLSLNFGIIWSEYIDIDSKFNAKTTGKVFYNIIEARGK